MTPDYLTLDDPRATDATVSGNKAAELARLRAAGFDVPDGVVLPAGLGEVWSSNGTPGWVREAAQRAHESLGGRLAVRSSSTWEDADTSAHAGATTTVLDVRSVDDTLHAIGRCLDGSRETQRARNLGGAVAVLLQELVPAEHAGVAFTADPITGERGVVRIAATAGLGEALVQGEVVGTDVTVRGTGPTSEVEGDLDGLPEEHARAVAAVAREIEAFHGRPQDVEWAMVDGVVRVLQARPITVLPVEPVPPQGNNWQKDVAHYPEPMTPFGWSLLNASADTVHSVFDEMGLMVRGLEEVLVGGEVYNRVIPAVGSPDSAGKPPPAFVLGLAARVVPALRRRTATAKQVLETEQMRRWVDDWHSTDRAAMQEWAARLADVDPAVLSDDELGAHLDACLEFLHRGTQIHFRLVMPLAGGLFRLHTLVGDALGWDDARIASMLAGHSPATRAAEEAMVELRRRVRSHAGAVEALDADPGRPVEVLEQLDDGLARDLRAWIDEHGWSLVNYDAGVPVLAERPTVITRLVLSEVSPDDSDDADAVAAEARDALPAGARADFDDALEEARAVYPLREDNTVIAGDRPLALLRRWMLEVGDRLAARGTIPSRGDAAYLFVDELRAALAGNEAEDLTERIVKRRGEEAWVRARPGPLYVGKQAPAPDISRLPEALRRVNEPVMWVIGHEYPDPVEAPADPDVLLAGVAASSGVAEGTVRVIRTHHDMDRLSEGDVLVCQVTSPAWAPLFPLAAAVVADGGGVLSHAAIAAREHGLPAVLGTADGTSTLRDGQRVRVDGTRGLVFALD